MAKTIPIFRGLAGLNNRIDPARLSINPETGIAEMAAAVNVDLDRTFRVSRRKGFSPVMTARPAHSLFDAGEYCLFVSGDALAVLDAAWDVTLIRNVTPDLPMRYARIDETVFYLNGRETGKVYDSDRLSRAWTADEYVGPETNRTFSDPPAGHLLAVFNGRMYVAKDDLLWYSEPFAYSWFDLARNFLPFGSRLRMVAPVDDGLFISDQNETWFFGGSGPADFLPRRMAEFPAIEGTDIHGISGGKIGNGDLPGKVALWASPEGICLGGAQGYFKNLTAERLVLPKAAYGAGVLAGDRYICSLQ